MSEARSDNEQPMDPSAARVVARIRWLMLISAATTLVAIAAVVIVIGYRLFHAEGSASSGGTPAEVTALLPKGARVTATAVAEDRLIVTIETAGGGVEIRTLDLKTLKPLGRLRFVTEP